MVPSVSVNIQRGPLITAARLPNLTAFGISADWFPRSRAFITESHLKSLWNDEGSRDRRGGGGRPSETGRLQLTRSIMSIRGVEAGFFDFQVFEFKPLKNDRKNT